MYFQNKKYKLERYPKTSNKSLKAWNAADELLLSAINEADLINRSIVVAHDSFGALYTALSHWEPTAIINNASQLIATRKNLELNDLNPSVRYSNPLNLKVEKIELAFIKLPKSMDLFRLYLQQIYNKLTVEGKVLCGFMTRNFSSKYVDIAEEYFEEVTQSRAEKKARLLILKSPKKDVPAKGLFHNIPNDLGLNLKQYLGVFSANRIDFATQLLLEHIPPLSERAKVIDLACGNGVIGAYMKKENATIDLTVLDDSYLAIQSAKLNLGKNGVTYLWKDRIPQQLRFDYIFCNPPFHLEYENTIDIALSLFDSAAKVLIPGGQFFIVANNHLNYRTHLSKLFEEVQIIHRSDKYQVIKCV